MLTLLSRLYALDFYLFSPAQRRVSSSHFGTTFLVLFCLSAVFNIRNLPVLSQGGMPSITLFVLAGVGFLLPFSVIVAELAAAWPAPGGMYEWIRQAFGERWGRRALYLDWMINITWLPLALSFIAGMGLYLIDAQLPHQPWWMFTGMMLLLWGMVLLNGFGMRLSCGFSGLVTLCGSVVPCVILIVLAGLHAGPHAGTWMHQAPLMTAQQHPSFAGLVLSLAGLEAGAFIIRSEQDLSYHYPRAVLVSGVLILVLSVLGAVAMIQIMPEIEWNAASGVLQAFEYFLKSRDALWLMPVMGGLLMMGSLATVNTWFIAPMQGIWALRQRLPRWLSFQNKHGVPIVLLLFQAVVSTVVLSVFLWIPSVNASYETLAKIAAQLILCLNMLIFISALCLFYRFPELPHRCWIPGGKTGRNALAWMGLLVCGTAFLMGFESLFG